VRTSVVVEVLPFLELLVEEVRVIDHDAAEETVELLGIDPVRALDHLTPLTPNKLLTSHP
jgi:hypothetical protein